MLLDLMSKRRSIRSYAEKPVENEKLAVLAKAVLLAPSSRGIFPCEYVIVRDKKTLEALSRAKAHGSSFLKNAPLGIVVCADTRKSDVWVEDASIASTYIMLFAQSLDLGSCWIQIRKRKNSEGESSSSYIRSVLGIPEGYEIESIIAIGYPEREHPAHTEDELDFEKLHYEKYQG